VVPLIAKRRDGQNDIGDEEMVSESVTAIAKCASTLEMHALNEGESLAEAKRTLSRMLPVFDSYTEKRDEDVDMGGVDNADRGTTKEGIFDDLPFAQSQCQTAWLELCAFIHNGHGFRPSAGAKLEVWRRVFEGCILHNIDLERQFLVGDVWKATLGEDSTLLSRGLFDAVVRRLAEAATGDAELKCSSDPIVLEEGC
jgi:sister chromatid cohesion protein DCC1